MVPEKFVTRTRIVNLEEYRYSLDCRRASIHTLAILEYPTSRWRQGHRTPIGMVGVFVVGSSKLRTKAINSPLLETAQSTVLNLG